MVETTTKNYGWTKPELTKSASTWGGFLNTDLDSIDSLVFANQQGIVPIGGITMFGGGTAPANWLICDGSALAHSTGGAYEALFAVIGYTYGGSGASFNLPNLSQRFPLGASGGTLAAAGGEAAHTLSAAEMPNHAHGVNDPTHAHSIADPGHAHGVNDPTHAHGASQDAHNHTFVQTDVGHSGVANGGSFAGTFANTTSTAQPAVHIGAAGTGISIGASGTGVGIYGAATGISIQAAGSNAAHNNLPPYLQINFIIRYQ